MRDPADLADIEQEWHLEASLWAQSKTKSQLPYKGHCYNCHEDLPAPYRFCQGEHGEDDAGCRDDYEYRMQRAKANGR